MTEAAMHAQKVLRLMIRDDGVIAHSTPGVLANPRFKPYDTTLEHLKAQFKTKEVVTAPAIEKAVEPIPTPETMTDMDTIDPSLMTREQLLAYGDKLGLKLDRRLKQADLLVSVNYHIKKS